MTEKEAVKMKRKTAAVTALALALLLFGCARQPAEVPATDRSAPAGTGQPPQAERWDYDLSAETAQKESKTADGVVLAVWSYEQPVLRLKNDAGETFPGKAPDRGVTEAQLAVCKAFNDRIAADTEKALQEYADTESEAQGQYEWKLREGIEFMPLSEEWSVDGVFRSGDLLSAAQQHYINLSGAHPDWARRSINFDLAEGRFFTVGELSDDAPALRAGIAAEVVDQIAASERADGYYEDFRDIVAQKEAFDAYMDESGVTVYFEEYELAPRALGVPEFTIPYAKLARWLNDDGRRLLPLTAEDSVMGDYYEAEEMWYWLEGGLPFDERYERDVPAPGENYVLAYYPVNIPGVRTLDDLRARFLTRFSEQVTDERLSSAAEGEQPLLLELDGALYTMPAGRGDDMYIESVDFRVETAGDSGSVIATIHWRDYDEGREEWYETGTEDVTMPYVLDGEGRARFTEFHTIW